MKSISRLLLVGLLLACFSGCILPASRSGQDPVMGTILGAQGLANAGKAKEQKKQKEQQQSVKDYLDKK
ncbi:MAG: hypothetical protein QM715_00690 [Nibricoccus sp.]